MTKLKAPQIHDEFKSLNPMPSEGDDAYKAFMDFVEMGPKRSLRKLHEQYRQSEAKVGTKMLSTIKEWNSRFEWQRRVLEYQQEMFQRMAISNQEVYSSFVSRAVPMVERLLNEVDTMLTNFAQLHVTRRDMIADPRDAALPPNQQRQMETIRMRVNTRELQQLVATTGQLLKDARTALGLPQVTEVKLDASAIKTYQTISPDDWDEPEA